MDKRTIGGVEFEAVRCTTPIPHWRLRVVLTGFLFEAGCFKSESRPKLWESVEHTARVVGDRWLRDNLTAHNAGSDVSGGPYVLWGFKPGHADGQPIKLCDYSRDEEITRTRQGWICSAYRVGEPATGLIALAGAPKTGPA